MKHRLKKTGFVAAAALLMTAMPVFAQEAGNPLPEVEVDGSVLQSLNPAGQDSQSLEPIQLVPPSLNRTATPLLSQSLTAADSAPQHPAAVPEPARVQERQIFQAVIEYPEADNLNPSRPATVRTSAPVQPAGKSVKANSISKPVKTEAKPKIALAGKTSKSINTTYDENLFAVPPAESIVSLLEDLKPVETLPSVPAAPMPIAVATAVDVTKPPVTMSEEQGIQAPDVRPVIFPVQTNSKTKGVFDPAAKAAALTPQAPVEPRPDTGRAIEQAMASPAPYAPENDDRDHRQANPKIIYKDVPTPRQRPNITVASDDFVQNARRVYQDTYKVVRRDGHEMPAIANPKVSSEKLPPTRLSVADIASDPLASQLVALSPNDIADALNDIAPSSGEPSRPASQEAKTSNKVHIVRENGNWFTRNPAEKLKGEPEKDKPVEQALADMPDRNSGRTLVVSFKAGNVDLPANFYGDIDQNVIPALKSDQASRVEIVSYASEKKGEISEARRVSLSRALSIRSYLVGKGIDATRMDVRAMGVDANAKADDRVELILVPSQDKKS